MGGGKASKEGECAYEFDIGGIDEGGEGGQLFVLLVEVEARVLAQDFVCHLGRHGGHLGRLGSSATGLATTTGGGLLLLLLLLRGDPPTFGSRALGFPALLVPGGVLDSHLFCCSGGCLALAVGPAVVTHLRGWGEMDTK